MTYKLCQTGNLKVLDHELVLAMLAMWPKLQYNN